MEIDIEAFKILVALAPGFLGFRVYQIDAYWSSIRSLDVFYGSLFFALVGYFAAAIFQGLCLFFDGYTSFFVVSTVAAVAAAIIWKKVGHPLFHHMLMKMGVTNEDNEGDVWQRIFANPKSIITQIVVYLQDGSQVMCDNTRQFWESDLEDYSKAKIYPYYSDKIGNIGMALTHYRKDSDSDWIENVRFFEQDWGVDWTFIPCDQIKRVDVRQLPK